MVQQKCSIFYIFLKKCKKPRKTWKVRGVYDGQQQGFGKKIHKKRRFFSLQTVHNVI